MNLLEAVDALRAMEAAPADEEAAHSEADGILLSYLRANDASALAEAYESARKTIGFWYA